MAQTIRMEDLGTAYPKILNPNNSSDDKDCVLWRPAIFTDKPVYRNGETIRASVYMFNLLDKTPTKCTNPKDTVLTLYDAQEKLIGEFKSNAGTEGFAQDHEFLVAADLPGGSYTIRQSSEVGDQVRIFILKFNPRDFALLGDWNQESVKINDRLSGKISLKVLSRATFRNASLSWRFTSQGAELARGTADITSQPVTINFTVPVQFSTLLVFEASANIDGLVVVYKKEFFEPIYDKVVVDFLPGSGKIFRGTNRIYFRAFEGEERKIETAITSANVIRLRNGATSTVVSGVKSSFEGKGFFDIEVTDADINQRSQFILRVKFDIGYERDFVAVNLASAQVSDVSLTSNKKVFGNSDLIELEIRGNKEVFLVIQDKTKILYSKLINVRRVQTERINANSLGAEYGGVFTVQLYTRGTAKIGSSFDPVDIAVAKPAAFEFNRRLQIEPQIVPIDDVVDFAPRFIPRPFPPKPQPVTNFVYAGTAQQEFEIFVEPRTIIGATASIEGPIIPGSSLDYVVRLDRACPRCAKANEDVYAHIDIVDLSAFVEIEKARVAPSLITKVFLEREVANVDREFFNAYQYVDRFFQTDSRPNAAEDLKLELLLGIQEFRKFLFNPVDLKKFVDNPYDQKYQKFKYAFDYLVAKNAPVYFPMYRREQMFEFDAFAANAVPKALPAAPVAPPTPSPAPAPAQPVDERVSLERIVKQDNVLHRNFAKVRNGRISGTFRIPARSATYAIRVHLVSASGKYGFINKTFLAQKEFNIASDLPLNIYRDEPLLIPITLENNKNVAVTVTLSNGARVTIPAKSSDTRNIRIDPANLPQVFRATDASTGQELDSINIAPTVLNPGVLLTESRSAYVSSASPLDFYFNLPDTLIKGGNSLRVCYKNSMLGLIIEAIRKLNQQPYGCFEQASTVSFPIVLALKLLLKLRPFTPDLQKLFDELLENLRKGIELLLKYECREGGFEWFGQSPCHSTLTAYGLWQFREIRDLGLDTPLFDYALIDRLINFLRTAKNGSGGFLIRQGLDALGNPDQEVSDIYISFVLSQDAQTLRDSFPDELSKVRDIYRTHQQQPGRLDSYRLALVALMYVNLGEVEAAKQIVIELFQRQKPSGEIAQSITSITRSAGISLAVETTALTLLVAMRAKYFDNAAAVDKCVQFLAANMQAGGYGSTQATILTLLAFSEYISAYKITGVTENYNIQFQGNNFATLAIAPNDLRPQCTDLSAALARVEGPGVAIQVRVAPARQTTSRAFFSIDLQYYDSSPQKYSNGLDAIIRRTSSGLTNVYEIQLRNRKDGDVGMTTFEFNKPACYDFNINDLDNMVKRQIIDFYEIRNSNGQVTIYYRGMRGGSTREFTLSLVKRYEQNTCAERVHSVYFYYEKDESILYPRAN